MNTLVIGCGEIGTAIKEIEEQAGNSVSVVDIDKVAERGAYDVIHICFPYSDNFVKLVKDYETQYNAPIKIIHSTLKLGTTDQLHSYVHSPCQGKHPKLKQSMLTFVKFVGGEQPYADAAVKHLQSLKIPAKYMGSPKTTEAAKLLDTSYYGWNIAFATRVNEFCKENDLDYMKVYVEWNKKYNKGYKEMKSPQFVRPILGPCVNGLGGHCVYENAVLLNYPSISDEIKKLGKE